MAILRVLPDTAMLLDIPVQLPDIVRGDLADGLAAQAGLDVVLDMMAVWKELNTFSMMIESHLCLQSTFRNSSILSKAIMVQHLMQQDI